MPEPKIVRVRPVAQGDGQKRVDQAAQRRRQEGGQQAQDHAYGNIRAHPGPDAVDILIGEGGAQAGDAAEIHDARHAQVEVAALFRQDLAHGAEEDDGAEDDGGMQQGGK